MPMKIIIYNDSNIVKDVIEGVEGVKSQTSDSITWSSGNLKGIKLNYEVVGDSNKLVKGDTINTDEIIETQREKKYEEISKACESEILKGFTSTVTGYSYRFNDRDQLNFTQRLYLLDKKPEITEVEWRTEDVGVYVHTRDEFYEIASIEAENHKMNNIQKKWQLDSDIKNASSVLELNAITW